MYKKFFLVTLVAIAAVMNSYSQVDFTWDDTQENGVDIIGTECLRYPNGGVGLDFSQPLPSPTVDLVFTINSFGNTIVTAKWDFIGGNTPSIVVDNDNTTLWRYSKATLYNVSLSVTYDNGQTSVKRKPIAINPVPSATFDFNSLTPIVACASASKVLTASFTTSGYSILWSTGDYGTKSVTVNKSSLYGAVVFDANTLCQRKEEVSVTFITVPAPTLTATRTRVVATNGETSTISASNADAYIWTVLSGDRTSLDQYSSPVVRSEITVQPRQNNTVYQAVGYIGVCASLPSQITIEVQDGTSATPLDANNVVMPGSQYNSKWIIKNIDWYLDGKLAFYTAWGVKVYETTIGAGYTWDATGSDGKFLPQDTYYYILKVKNPNNSNVEINHRGFVTVLR